MTVNLKLLGQTGRILFLLALSLYVILHFTLADYGVQNFVPTYLPFPYAINYFTGACILAFIVSGLWGKYDLLAALLFAVYMLLVIFLVHVPKAGVNDLDLQNTFRGVGMLGSALMYAAGFARDHRLPGIRIASATPQAHA